MQSNTGEQSQQTMDIRRMVTFTAGTEEFGVPILAVREIVRMMEITIVPNSPPDVEGIVNLRGKVIPVVDLRRRFRMENADKADEQRIIVLELGEHTVGFTVDTVGQVLSADSDQIEHPPTVSSGNSAAFIDGIVKLDDRLVILLDPNKLISGEVLDQLDEATPMAA